MSLRERIADERTLDYNFPDKGTIISHIILTGLICAITYHFIILNVPPFSAKKPYNTFLFHPEERFNDLRYLLLPYIRDMNPAAMISYFPGSFILIEPISYLGSYALPAYLLFSFLGIASLIYMAIQVGTRQERWCFLIAMMLSYPLIFSFDRANLELVLLILILLWYRMRSSGRDVLASLFIGLAGAAKLYPLLFLLPDLVNFRWRRLFLTAGFAGLFCLLGLLLLPEPPVESIRLLSRSLKFGHDLMVHRPYGVPYSTSALSFVKFMIVCFFHDNASLSQTLVQYSSNYSYIGSSVGIVLMLFAGWKLRRQDEWKLLFVAAAAMILLTPVSFDYKLTHLFLPCILFVNNAARRLDYLYATLFGILLIPKAYYFLPNQFISIAVAMNPMLICFMSFYLVLSVRSDALCCVFPQNEASSPVFLAQPDHEPGREFTQCPKVLAARTGDAVSSRSGSS
jgi:hypothetical protein